MIKMRAIVDSKK